MPVDNLNVVFRSRTAHMRIIVLAAAALLAFAATLALAPLQANAQELKLNSSQDITFNGDETPEFTVSSPAKGYFSFQLTMLSITNTKTGKAANAGYMYYKVTSNYLDYESSVQVSLGVGVKSTAKYCFKRGRKVTLKLYNQSGSSSYTYTVRVAVKWAKSANFEREYNNSKKSATTLNLKKTYTGLRSYKDTDWWCFKAPKTKKYRFYVVCTECSGYGMGVDIYKGKTRLRSANSVTVGGGWVKASCKLKKGQKVYMKLSNYYLDYPATYKVKVR